MNTVQLVKRHERCWTAKAPLNILQMPQDTPAPRFIGKIVVPFSFRFSYVPGQPPFTVVSLLVETALLSTLSI